VTIVGYAYEYRRSHPGVNPQLEQRIQSVGRSIDDPTLESIRNENRLNRVAEFSIDDPTLESIRNNTVFIVEGEKSIDDPTLESIRKS